METPSFTLSFGKMNVKIVQFARAVLELQYMRLGVTLLPQLEYETRQKARKRQQTEEFKKQYALRSGIEGTLSQGIRGFGLRQCLTIGLAKSHLQHILTATAMNLMRVFNWLENRTLAKTRSSHLARFAYAHFSK